MGLVWAENPELQGLVQEQGILCSLFIYFIINDNF